MAIKKCTRLPALTVERNVKFHSNLTAAGQYTAENATANEDHQEDIKLICLPLLSISFFQWKKMNHGQWLLSFSYSLVTE